MVLGVRVAAAEARERGVQVVGLDRGAVLPHKLDRGVGVVDDDGVRSQAVDERLDRLVLVDDDNAERVAAVCVPYGPGAVHTALDDWNLGLWRRGVCERG